MKSKNIKPHLISRNCKFLLIIIIMKVFYTMCECERDIPINRNGNCEKSYCTKEEFDSGECIVENSVIKTQWLNNIFIYDDNNYGEIQMMTYPSMAINSNGDLFLLASNSYYSKRLFFGIKNNGEFIFINEKDNGENELTPFKLISSEDFFTPMRQESGLFFIKTNSEPDIEYLLSISIFMNYVELYDPDNIGKIPPSISETFSFSGTFITSIINNLLKIKDSEGNDYYSFFFNSMNADSSYICIFAKLNFESYDNLYNLVETKYQVSCDNTQIVSYFQTESNKYLVFFFIDSNNFFTICLHHPSFDESEFHTIPCFALNDEPIDNSYDDLFFYFFFLFPVSFYFFLLFQQLIFHIYLIK